MKNKEENKIKQNRGEGIGKVKDKRKQKKREEKRIENRRRQNRTEENGRKENRGTGEEKRIE